MKSLKFLAFIPLLIFFFSCQGQQNPVKKSDSKTAKIQVIDFHSTHRCFTCNAIEENTKNTLDTYFSKQIKEGIISFQIINVDEKENEKIAEKFEAFGTSLFLNVISNGNEKAINLTDFAFENAREKDNFVNGLKDKIEEQLKSL